MNKESVSGKILRVGEITFANTFPVFYYLRTKFPLPFVSYVPGVPSALNLLLRQGRIDLSPSSSIEYARGAEDYLLLPGYCIASAGPVWSIRLFSLRPLEKLDGCPVILTGESDTSSVLCRIILDRFFGLENEFLTLDTDLEQGLEQAQAVLLIGDKALAAGPRAKNIHIYDLGELWHRETGLPFVYALWIVRKQAADRQPALLADFWKALELAHQALARPGEDLFESVLTAKPFLDRRTAEDYWRIVSYRLDSDHLRGLELFYRLAHELGQLDPPPGLRFYDPEKKF